MGRLIVALLFAASCFAQYVPSGGGGGAGGQVNIFDSAGNPLDSNGSGALEVAGSFTASPPTSNSSSSPAQTPVGSGSIVHALAANASRKRYILKNGGVTVIYVCFGAFSPSSSLYHIALQPGGTANDGFGAVWVDDLFLGDIYVISSAAGGLLYVTEFV